MRGAVPGFRLANRLRQLAAAALRVVNRATPNSKDSFTNAVTAAESRSQTAKLRSRSLRTGYKR